MKNALKKFGAKLTAKKSKGFDGLIVTIGLILLVMILIFAFKSTIGTQVSDSIDTVSDEIQSISNWEAK